MNIEKRRLLNKKIVECANNMRIYLRGIDKYEELENYNDLIKTMISKYANEVYYKDEKEISNSADVYSVSIASLICSFIEDFCNNNGLAYVREKNLVFVEGEIINPICGIGNVYEKLNKIKSKSKFQHILNRIKKI